MNFSNDNTTMNYNKCQIAGRLTKDIELRHTASGRAVAEMLLATNRRHKDGNGVIQEDTTYTEITLWGRDAEVASQYLAKGKAVFIDGRLQTDTWEDKATGQKRQKLKIVCEHMTFLPGQTVGGKQENRVPADAPTSAMSDSLDSGEDDNDFIPF